ncbi:class I SAM-dependent methyltransferase [Ramlibacter solisilvae]|uniref:Methyltransferase n=1 Tax=Ramlibacter tataouinensis TaxID=94132 RepID=A0A127JNX2_9BURK|nr:methyltransferase domain-containing protein [Ramlibacter tataouinensis]AMO21714.1 methyltransferase [Ramlibacter tataouinensis]
MSTRPLSDHWEQGNPYEQYIGRWSRRVAPLFLSWLGQPAGKRWVDVGCGTGALSTAILDHCSPGSVVGIDPSEGFLKLAVQELGIQASFLSGSAAALPLADGAGDVIVSGLVLNFIPDLPAALAEMARVASPGGTIAAYVWDYADKMEVIRHFWDAAVAVDPAAAPLHEGHRFPLCNPAALREAFERAGFTQVNTAPLDVTAVFAGFDDYWRPFLGGQGPAPAYAMSLPDERRAALRAALQARVPSKPDGSISLTARAWAIRGST